MGSVLVPKHTNPSPVGLVAMIAGILRWVSKLNNNIMATVVGGMKGLRAVELVSRARVIEEHMTGNLNFPDAGPLIAAMVVARDALQLAIVEAMDGGRTAHFIQRLRKAELKDRMTQVYNHVLSVALGDMIKLMSSGFPERKPAARIGPLHAPQKLVAVHGDHPGQVFLRWGPVYGARLYELEMNAGDPDEQDGWLFQASMPHAHHELVGLASLRYYWFRVLVIGTEGKSPWSDPAMSVVL